MPTIECDQDCTLNVDGKCTATKLKIVTEEEYGHPVCRTRIEPRLSPEEEKARIARGKANLKALVENNFYMREAVYVDPETGGVFERDKRGKLKEMK